MSGSVEKMVLCCAYCGEEADEDAVIEAYLLHSQVEHDTDEVKFDLKAKCRCGMLMELIGSEGTLHRFRCPNGHEGSLRMTRTL